MGADAGPAPDYQALQNSINAAGTKQLANNRLSTSNPFSSQTFDGNSTSTQFTGGLGDAANGLNAQAGGLATPMDWSKLGSVGTGNAARDQAVNAAYGQATSRLDPQWDRRMEGQRTQLLNQGLDPTSEAYRGAMQEANFARNDAYGSAMNSAIGQGTAAGDSVFRNNMLSRGQALSEMLQQRNQPLDELQRMQGLLAQPGYAQDSTSLGAAMGSANYAQQAYKQQADKAAADNAATGQTVGGIGSALGAGAGILAMLF